MLITKKQIIKALATEPLKPGAWVSTRNFAATLKAPCKVCAVGAVLRKTLPKSTTLRTLSNIADTVTESASAGSCKLESITKELEQGKYMRALSNFFENECNQIGRTINAKVRRKTIAFVEAHFPDVIEIDTESEAA